MRKSKTNRKETEPTQTGEGVAIPVTGKSERVVVTDEQLKAIDVTKVYISQVKIDDGEHIVALCTNEYYTGMYVAMYLDGNLIHQGGNVNATTQIKGLIKDLRAAIKRGDTVFDLFLSNRLPADNS